VMIGSTTVSIPERWTLMQSVSRAVAGMHMSRNTTAPYDGRDFTDRTNP
jgi:hypothetical protein